MDLWKDLDKIITLFKQSPVKILMLDFDGTLTPIVNSPKKAVLSAKTRNLLKELSRKKGFYVAIISGRKLGDLKEKIGLPNLIYAGNHGLEGEIGGKSYTHPIPKEVLINISKVQKKLKNLTDKFNGAFIEDKGQALSLHFRMVHNQQIPALRLQFNKIIRPFKAGCFVSVIAGKKVFDILPKVDWDKGHFVNLVLEKINLKTKTKPIAIFIGDDLTDEDVFQVLENDVTIKVGKNHKSNAKYSLKNTKEVFTFLEWVNKKL